MSRPCIVFQVGNPAGGKDAIAYAAANGGRAPEHARKVAVLALRTRLDLMPAQVWEAGRVQAASGCVNVWFSLFSFILLCVHACCGSVNQVHW